MIDKLRDLSYFYEENEDSYEKITIFTIHIIVVYGASWRKHRWGSSKTI